MSEPGDPTVPVPVEPAAANVAEQPGGAEHPAATVPPADAAPPATAPPADAAQPASVPTAETSPAVAAPAATQLRPSRWRAAAAAVLIVLGVILVPVTAVSWWVRGTVTDTDKWVAAVAPLASDPQVQSAVTDQVTDRVMERIESLNLAQQATDELIARGVPPQFAAVVSLISSPLRDRVQSTVHNIVAQVVASQIFSDIWTGANRVVHTQLLALLNGEQGALSQNESGELALNLSAIAGPLRTALVDAGVPGADKIPDINTQVVVGDGSRISQAKDAYRLVKGIPVLLLFLTIILLVLGVFFSHRRLRAALFTLAGIVVAILITLAAVKYGRDYAVDNLRQDVRGAAQAMITIVTDRLRTMLRVVGWLALIALAVALVSGNGPRARSLRRQVRRTSEAAWGRTMEWQHSFVVSLAVTIVAVVVLFVTDLPTFWNVLLVVIAIAGGLTAWFSSRPDEIADTAVEAPPDATAALPSGPPDNPPATPPSGPPAAPPSSPPAAPPSAPAPVA